jgi:hypothetical protein
MQDPSHESQFFESQLSVDIPEPEPAASAEEEDSAHAAGSSQPEEHSSDSHKRRTTSTPVEDEQESKRVKKVDEEYEPPLSSSSSEEGEISVASDSDSPMEYVTLFEGGESAEDNANIAYEDSAFFQECRKGLIALKTRLTKAMKKDEFDHVYPMFKVDDDLTDEFVSFVAETLIDWQKFADDYDKENKKEGEEADAESAEGEDSE